MTINFPSSPSINDVFEDFNSGNYYIWNGYAWVGYATTNLQVSYSTSAISIEDDSSLVGSATTIDFGANLSVSPISAGIVTITSSGGGGGGATVTVSDTEPTSPSSGNLWYDKSIGRGFIYYNDGTSSQWVDFSPAIGGGLGGVVGISTDSERLNGQLPSYYLDYNNFTNEPTGLSSFSNDVGFITSFTDTNYWNQTISGIHTLSNIGIGTTDSGTANLAIVNSSGTASFSIGQNVDGTGLDHLGIWYGYNGSNANIFTSNGNLRFDVDGAGGSTSQIEFGRGLGSETNFVINSSGNIGIGTTIPQGTLQVGTGITMDGSSGIISATQFSGNSLKLATNNVTIVGTSGTTGEIKRIGGAPFFYDGSAWREFVLSSGTPVSVPADTEWDNVVFRATFDSDFTDAKFGATPVYIGAGSSIVGAAVTIGTGSLRLDGVAGAGLSYAYRSDYNFTGSWTIEFWMYHDTVDSMTANGDYSESIISFGSLSGVASPGFLSLAINRDGFGNIRFRWYNNNNGNFPFELYATSGAAYNSTSVDKWRHYALVREADNGSLHFYIDGVESNSTISDGVIDNNILNEVGAGLWFGSTPIGYTVQNDALNSSKLDAYIDDVRISCGVGTAGQRYNSIGITTYATFIPPTTALPITGTLSSYVQPPGDKYGEITLGGSPTWRGTSGVTVSQQSSGNYRVSFASTYTNAKDYYVLSQGMDQGFASYVGIARSTTHVDLSINKQSDNTAVNTGALAVQIKNHI